MHNHSSSYRAPSAKRRLDGFDAPSSRIVRKTNEAKLLAIGAIFALVCLVSAPALRAQTMSGSTLTLSDWASIGFNNDVSSNSLIVGSNGVANNYSLIVGGDYNYAEYYSIAAGDSAYASWASMAVGFGGVTATNYSAAIGEQNIADNDSMALGFYTRAYNMSFASGTNSQANGTNAVAVNNGAVANGASSFAAGSFTLSTGATSAAFGYSTTAKSYASFVVGQFNKTSGSYNATSWVATDPLFVVGNGTASNAQSDAFVIYKNGKIKMQVAQGDISMGAFAQ